MLRILSPISRVFWKGFIKARWLIHSFGKKAVEAGEPIPDFTLCDLYGRPVTLSHAFPKKAVVLWLTNLCSSCEERIGLLQKVYTENRDRLEIIAISTLGNDRNTPERTLRAHRIGFPLLLDPEDWIEEVLATAKRAGLFCSDDFASATRMIAKLAGEAVSGADGIGTALGAVLGGADLVRFYLSDEYHRLRELLSNPLPVPAA